MNLIKHIANLLALWTIPFVFVLFFMLVSGFAFTYHDAVTAPLFIIVYVLYYIMIFIIYMTSNEEECDSFKIFKTN
jgi:hypothetical protein